MTYEERMALHPNGECPHCPSRLCAVYIAAEKATAGIVCAGCGTAFAFEHVGALEVSYKGDKFSDPAFQFEYGVDQNEFRDEEDML